LIFGSIEVVAVLQDDRERGLVIECSPFAKLAIRHLKVRANHASNHLDQIL